MCLDGCMYNSFNIEYFLVCNWIICDNGAGHPGELSEWSRQQQVGSVPIYTIHCGDISEVCIKSFKGLEKRKILVLNDS